MNKFTATDGVEIAYEMVGEGVPIVLVHGFASNYDLSWKRRGWVDMLVDIGHLVIGLDIRGHGQSDKPHKPDSYGSDRIPRDVLEVMDKLGIQRAVVMGYSLGAMIALYILARQSDRLSAVVIGGFGAGSIPINEADIVAGKIVAERNEESDANGFSGIIQQISSRQYNDPKALSALLHASFELAKSKELANATVPTLIVAGDKDKQAGDPQKLCDLIPGAQLFLIPGTDHSTTLHDNRFKQKVAAFLRTDSIMTRFSSK